MTCTQTFSTPPGTGGIRPWILIAAYDVSIGETSEGHVAFNILRQLHQKYRIILVTRKNNKSSLAKNRKFLSECPGIRIVGYDLPKWACWWKRGPRFYQAYAYLWQMTWPLTLKRHRLLRNSLGLVHVLNFHNDSIPSLAWMIGPPLIWGPINHNESIAQWRRKFWPKRTSIRHVFAFTIRRFFWLTDPFLKLQIRKARVILSAGGWVDSRLGLKGPPKVIRCSQLGVHEEEFQLLTPTKSGFCTRKKKLIYAGRLDWIKGVDLAIEALALLPKEFSLQIVGKGPAESRLRALAAKKGVENRILFQPPVSRTKLSEFYAKSDLFLFPSAEVAGLVWIEALACGLPVVAFDGETELASAARTLPGLHTVKTHGGRHNQIEGFASTILAAISGDHNTKCISDAALMQYGWPRLAATIRDIYAEVLRTTE